MKNIKVVLIVLLTAAHALAPATASAEEFSLFGVSMGMTRSEIDQLWSVSSDGEYIIEGSIISNIVTEFDHRERLYRLGFSTPIPLMDQYPGPYAATAFQKAVQERWVGGDATVSTRTGRGIADISVTSRSLLDEYNRHIQAQMEFQLNSIFKTSPAGTDSQP